MKYSKAVTLFTWERDDFDQAHLTKEMIIDEVNKSRMAGHNLKIGEYRYDKIITTAINNFYISDTGLEDIINECDGMKNYLLNEIVNVHLHKVINYCTLLGRNDMLRVILHSGIRLDSGMIKEALSSGRVEAAKIMVEEGVPLPDKIPLFDISHQLAWEPDRVRFIIDNKIKVVLSDKERISIGLLFPYIKGNGDDRSEDLLKVV